MSDINGKKICKTYEKNDTSILFYDCNKTLTDTNDIGEIKFNNRNNFKRGKNRETGYSK